MTSLLNRAGRALRFEGLEFRCLLSANPGDFNASGHVDAADYILWRNADSRADSNNDTHIDQTDYTAWRSNFGNTYSSSGFSITATDVPLAIPDEGLVQSHVTVTSAASINDVKIKIDISHPYDSDLQAYLISPLGTRVQLFSGVGDSGANFQGTVLDDDASTSILDGAAPFTGSFRPSQHLSAFAGESAQGIWTLEVSDHFPGDEGTLLGWTLAFNDAPLSASGATTTAGPETAQTSPAPVSFAGRSSALLSNVHPVQSKAHFPERNAATTLQPETTDLLLSIHSFSRVDAARLQAATFDLQSASKDNLESIDRAAADVLIAADFKPFEQF